MPPTSLPLSRSSARFYTTLHRYVALPPSHQKPQRPTRALLSHPTYRPPRRRSHTASASQGASANTESTTPQFESSQPSPPPQNQTHYTLFPQTLPSGPPPHGPFKIPLRTLRNEYIRLQSLAHPDKHSGADKSRAEGTSALINEAYKTLQDPLRRAQYLLSLRGMDVGEDDAARVDDPALLMEVMEAREVIEGAREEGDVVGVREENEGRIRTSEEVLAGAFARDDIEGAREEAVRLRYWVNIRESVGNWEEGGRVVH